MAVFWGVVAGSASAAPGSTINGETTATRAAVVRPSVPDKVVPESGEFASWRETHRRLGKSRDRLAAYLGQAHARLLSRARIEHPELVLRLSDSPAPRQHGFGIVPELVADAVAGPITPTEKLFSLLQVESVLETQLRDAETLAAAASSGSALETQVQQFERMRARMRNVEEHLNYHEHWQQAVVAYPEYFAGRNRLIVKMRESEVLRQRGGPAAQVEQLRRAVLDEVAPFTATAGLVIERRADGRQVLPVTVHTDIADDAFLAIFRDAVEAHFVHSPAARQLGFAVDLEFRRVALTTLYPVGAPALGANMDMAEHLARFPAGALVLTTGAESTYAVTNQYVVLGPGPVTRRTLAHEFAHLLGYRDAYLRGFDGDPSGPYGATLVEWVGLMDDLMGNSEHGRVTEGMIRDLLQTCNRCIEFWDD